MDDGKTLLFDEDVEQGEKKRTIYRTEYKYKGVLALVTWKSSETILRGNIRGSPRHWLPVVVQANFTRQAKFTTLLLIGSGKNFLLCNLIFKFSDMKGPILVRFGQFGGRRARIVTDCSLNTLRTIRLPGSIIRKSDTTRLPIDAGILYL
jgi:hypothetical protein